MVGLLHVRRSLNKGLKVTPPLSFIPLIVLFIIIIIIIIIAVVYTTQHTTTKINLQQQLFYSYCRGILS